MAEVRKYFCCTDNLTGCKIVGGVQIALNAILLIISLVGIIAANEIVSQHQGRSPQSQGDASEALGALAIVVLVFYGLGILVAILLVVGAVKRSASMLMVWIVLNAIGIALSFIGLFGGGGIIQSLAAIGIGIWAELIAIGAREEVKSGAGIA